MREDLRAIRKVLPLLQIDVKRITIAIILGSVTIGSSVGLAAVSAWLIVRASQMPPVLDLSVATVSVRALGISRGVFRYLERLASHDVALRGVVSLREQLYLSLAKSEDDRISTWRRGEILRRLGNDVDTVSDLVVRAVIPTAVGAVSSLVSLGILAAFSPKSALILLAMLLFTGIVNPLIAAAGARRQEQARLAAQGRISAATVTILDGAAELRVQGRLEPVFAELDDAEARAHASIDAGARPLAWAHASQILAMGITVVGVLLIAIPEMLAGSVNAVELAVLVLTPLTAFEATATMPEAGIEAVRSAAAARRITDLLEQTHPQGPQGTQELPVAAQEVSAHELQIGWPGHVLPGRFDLTITPGKSLVITGPSGCGKTTLLLTLAGLLPAQSGQVRHGQIPTPQLKAGASAALVTYTAEDAHIFDTTVLENLRVMRGDLTEDEAWAALEQVKLAELVRSLPEGIHTRLGSGGNQISGGERRRILVARALVSRAPLLFFDEPAEHLDPETGAGLLRDIVALSHTRGIVVVTHHRDGIEHADQLLDLAKDTLEIP